MTLLVDTETTADKAVTQRGAVFEKAAAGRRARPLFWFGLFALVTAIAFSKSLIDLVRFATETDLFSYIYLIPFISVYLIWQKREELAGIECQRSRWAFVPAIIGVAILAYYWVLRARGGSPGLQDYLCMMMLSWYAILLAGGFYFLGSGRMKAMAFPVAFLAFAAPMPVFAIDGLETFLQHASAEATNAFLYLTGRTYLRDGLVFKLPGMELMKVGQVCSGIRSSLVLFMVSLVAGHLLLRRTGHKALFAALVIPLGILRNGFRIWTLAVLSVHVDPRIIDSPLHHRGGPIFFLLSLAPFFLILLFLRKRESREDGLAGVSKRTKNDTTKTVH